MHTDEASLRSLKIRGIVGAGLVASWLGACGGVAESPEHTPPSDVVAACAENARIACELSDACQGGSSTLLYGSEETCAARTALSCEHRATSPGAGYGSAEIKTCIANQQAQTCEEWVGTLTPGCGFVGTRANGTNCEYGSQCASGFCDAYRYYTDGNVCGVCANPPVEGQACNSSCGGDGTVRCEHDGTAGRCVRLGAMGQACGATAHCATGLNCAIAANATIGQCLPATANEGDPCDDEVGPLCDYRRRIYCNALTATCVMAQNAGLGEICGSLADGGVAQCANSVCQPAGASAHNGKCIAFLADGAACTYGPGSIPCTPPALCAYGQCRIVGGELCD